MQRSFFLALKYGGQALSTTSSDKQSPGGSIIVTSSMAGVNGAVSDISYCEFREPEQHLSNFISSNTIKATAKAAVASMVRPGAVQLSGSHIRVNSIAPGFVRTSIVATSASTFAGQAFDENLDTGAIKDAFDNTLGRYEGVKYYYERIPEPIEIANIGVFLASPLGASINGQNIVADSGKTVAAFRDTIIAPIQPLSPLI